MASFRWRPWRSKKCPLLPKAPRNSKTAPGGSVRIERSCSTCRRLRSGDTWSVVTDPPTGALYRNSEPVPHKVVLRHEGSPLSTG